MVKPKVWWAAWDGRARWWQEYVPGQMVLCVGCLEARIGRTLRASDFTKAPLNDPDKHRMSDRLLDRLRRKNAAPKFP
jgi:hypothetical protein